MKPYGVTLPAVGSPEGWHPAPCVNAMHFKEHELGTWLVHVAQKTKFLSLFFFFCIAIFILLFLTRIFSILISSRWEDISPRAVLHTAAGHPGQQWFETPSLPHSPAGVRGLLL